MSRSDSGRPRIRDLKAAETKRLNISIWHQPLFSPCRALVGADIHLSVSSSSLDLSCTSRVSRPIRLARSLGRRTRRVADYLSTLSGEREKERRHEGWSPGLENGGERARGGPTSDGMGQEKVRGKIEKSQEYREEAAAGWQKRQRGWLNPGLFARSKWRSAVILKFSRWQGARIGLKNQSGSLFLMITASRPESGNCCCCCCFLPIPPLPATSALRHCLSVSSIHVPPRPPPVPPSLSLPRRARIPLLSVALPGHISPRFSHNTLSPRVRFSQSISRTAATYGIIAATDHRYRHRQPL